ncbi:MAG: tetratricopeptide repeat protein, partial [Caulobacteraceae bacterium]
MLRWIGRRSRTMPQSPGPQPAKHAFAALEAANRSAAAGRFDEAASHYVRALTLSPGAAEAWAALADCHRAARRLDEAILACEAGLRHLPGHPRILCAAARALQDQ